jgi:hypothetical protein
MLLLSLNNYGLKYLVQSTCSNKMKQCGDIKKTSAGGYVYLMGHYELLILTINHYQYTHKPILNGAVL